MIKKLKMGNSVQIVSYLIFKDQKVWKQEGQIVDYYSKAFVIPILTAIRGNLHVANVLCLALRMITIDYNNNTSCFTSI